MELHSYLRDLREDAINSGLHLAVKTKAFCSRDDAITPLSGMREDGLKELIANKLL
jgi:hypothetical protein